MTAVAPTTSGTTAYVDFNDADISAHHHSAWLLDHNSSDSNKVVAVFDFGSDLRQQFQLYDHLPYSKCK